MIGLLAMQAGSVGSDGERCRGGALQGARFSGGNPFGLPEDLVWSGQGGPVRCSG